MIKPSVALGGLAAAAWLVTGQPACAAAAHHTAGAAIPGFALGDEAGLPSRGFSLGESEITLAANIDPYFYGSLTASISGDDDISVEEAFIQTTALPGGVTFKAGRF